MAIILKPDGSFVFDTPEEALAVASRLHGSRRDVPTPVVTTAEVAVPSAHAPLPPPTTSWAGWAEFVKYLHPSHRQILAIIQDRRSVRLNDLAESLGKRNNEIAALLTGLIKVTKRAGIDVSSLYRKTVKGYGRNREITYHVGRLLEANDLS